MVDFYERVGFQKIYVSDNPSFKQITATWKTIEKQLIAAAEQWKVVEEEFKKPEEKRDKAKLKSDLKPLLCVYFSGHGVFDQKTSKTKCLMNEADEKNRYFPL